MYIYDEAITRIQKKTNLVQQKIKEREASILNSELKTTGSDTSTKGFTISEVPLATAAALGITLAGREKEVGSSEAVDLAGSNRPVLGKLKHALA